MEEHIKTNHELIMENAVQIWDDRRISFTGTLRNDFVTKFIRTEEEFLDVFGNPYKPTNKYILSTPMPTDEVKDKLIADLDQERHNMIDVMREKEKRASDFKYVIMQMWNDLCGAYENKSSIKEISRVT